MGLWSFPASLSRRFSCPLPSEHFGAKVRCMAREQAKDYHLRVVSAHRADEFNAAEHIEAALGELRADHARSALESAFRKQRRSQLIRWAAGAVAALAIGALGLAWSGVGSIDRARILTESRAVALGNALDRQASLVPTLVSLQAGSSERLLGLARQMGEAADLTAKRSVSRAINLALAQDLAGLPTGSEATQAPERLSLQYEIVGTQNRVSVEGRRYDDALQSWHQAASSLGGRIACLLGLAKRPPGR
jgi:LemA protein